MPDSTKMPELGLSEMLGGGFMDESLHEAINKYPEAAREMLKDWEDETRRFIDDKGQILRDALKKQLTIGEKFGLMARMWLFENIVPMVDQVELDSGFVQNLDHKSFQESSNLSGAQTLDDAKKNIYVPSNSDTGFFEKFASTLGALELMAGNGGKIPLPVERTVVLSAKEKDDGLINNVLSPTISKIYKKCGVDFKIFNPRDQIPMPGSNELQMVQVPQDGIPLNQDGSADLKTLQDLVRLFDRGNVEWHTNPLLTASILVLKGLAVEEAMKKFQLHDDEQGNISNLLRSLVQPISPPAPVANAGSAPTAVQANTAPALAASQEVKQ